MYPCPISLSKHEQKKKKKKKEMRQYLDVYV